MNKYEIEITNEIKNDKSNTKIWKYINKLKGNDDNSEFYIYNENGNIIPKLNEKEEVLKFWKPTYQKQCSHWVGL